MCSSVLPNLSWGLGSKKQFAHPHINIANCKLHRGKWIPFCICFCERFDVHVIYILQSLPNIWCNFLTCGLMTTCWCYSISEIAWMKYKLCTPKRNLVSSASPTCHVSVSIEDAAPIAGFRDHMVNCCSKDSSCINHSVRNTKYLFSFVYKYIYCSFKVHIHPKTLVSSIYMCIEVGAIASHFFSWRAYAILNPLPL